MSFRFKTQNSIIVDTNLFFAGTATYDKTTTPSNENKITASDGSSNDYFGESVAVGSGRIVVGAFGDSFGFGFSSAGSAYIFDLDGTQLAKITAPDRAQEDYFGYAVAVGSGRIVVGAYGDDDDGSISGSAYIFDLDGTFIKKITASDGAGGDRFGWSVAVGCGRIVVTSPFDDDNGSASGSAYIFDLDGNQLSKITASDGVAGDRLGYGGTLSVGCGRIVVGATDATIGSNGDQGAVYIFDLDGNQLGKIIASDGSANKEFGKSVAVGCGRIVAGGHLETGGGAAYIYDLDGNNEVKITASDGAGGDNFGYVVAVGNGRIVVGAYGDDDNGTSSGSAYIFDLDGNQLSKITASDGAANDEFGKVVAVGSGKIIVGAWGDDDNGLTSGSAYIYDTPKQIHYLDQLDGR